MKMRHYSQNGAVHGFVMAVSTMLEAKGLRAAGRLHTFDLCREFTVYEKI